MNTHHNWLMREYLVLLLLFSRNDYWSDAQPCIIIWSVTYVCCLYTSCCILATTQPNVLITVGNSCPSTQVCLPFSSFNQHRPAIQLLSSSPPTIKIVLLYFTMPEMDQIHVQNMHVSRGKRHLFEAFFCFFCLLCVWVPIYKIHIHNKNIGRLLNEEREIMSVQIYSIL